MSPTSWVNSALNRLKYLAKPIPLISISGALVLGIFIWEYTHHPEWFDTYSPAENAPGGADNLSGLTPEEQAAVADIDNLSVLFNELGIGAEGTPNIQALPENSQNEQTALLGDLLRLSQPLEGAAEATEESIFAKYLDQYQFLGSSSTRAEQTNMSLSENQPGLGDRRDNASLRPLSALETALQNQAAARLAQEAAPTTETTNDAPSSLNAANSLSDTEEPGQATTDSDFGSQAVTIPGVPFPVLPTTPQMSPPPGTTGYTPPASLQVMPPLPGTSTSNPLPQAGVSNLTPSSAGIPTIPSGAGVPNLNTPQVDIGNGYVTPYTPVVPAPVPSTTSPVPAPFSAPRPPGSYLGGGYINTFSNPTAPRQ